MAITQAIIVVNKIRNYGVCIVMNILLTVLFSLSRDTLTVQSSAFVNYYKLP